MLPIFMHEFIYQLQEWTLTCLAFFRNIPSLNSSSERPKCDTPLYYKTTDVFWKIQNFSCSWLGKSGRELQSGEFLLDTAENSSWVLKLRTKRDFWTDDIGLFLQRSPQCSGPTSIVVDFDVAILDSDENTHKLVVARKQVFKRGQNCGFEAFVNGKELFENNYDFLPCDTLTIRCRIRHLSAINDNGIIRSGDLKLLLKTYIKVNRHKFLWKIKRHSSSCEDRRKIICVDRLFNAKKKTEVVLNYEIGNSESAALESIHLVLSGLEKGNLWNCSFRLLDNENDFYDCSMLKTCLWFVTHNSEHEWKLDLPKSVTEKLDKSWFVSFMSDDYVYFACEFAVSARIPVHSTTRLVSTSDMNFSVMDTIINKLMSISYLSLGYENVGQTQDSTNEFDDQDEVIRELELSETTENSLASDIRKFYFKNVLTDFTLHAGNDTFKIHKCILASRSYVFAQMFQIHPESADSFLDPDSLRHLLHFLYTGTLEDTAWTSVCNLYRAAHLYCVPILKRRCTDLIVAGMDVSNVCDVLQLADSHQDSGFRSVAEDFIAMYEKDVLVSEGWKVLMEVDVELAARTMYVLFEKKLSE